MGILSRFNSHLRVICSVFMVSLVTPVWADEPTTSEGYYLQGKVAFEAKMYEYSQSFFEQSLELDRSNYPAMLYLAKVFFYTGKNAQARKQAEALVSSFYPARDLKIETFQLLRDIENKEDNPWLALSYAHAASSLSTNVNISHIVDDQMNTLNFDFLDYPDFGADADGVMTSPTLSFADGVFRELDSKIAYRQVSYSVRSLNNTKFVVLAGFDERKRFTKLLLIRIKPGLKPKLEEVAIQGRRRGGIQGADDLYLKIMDWNFDGYPDLVVRVSPKRTANKQAFLLFNPRNEQFELNEALSRLDNPILDLKTKAVIEEECTKGKDAMCMRKRYKLFAGEYALAQFEKNRCQETCIYTKAEIEVSSLKSKQHMYLVNTIETQYEQLKSKFSSSAAAHTIITRRELKAFYTPNYDVDRSERPIMTLDLDGSWEFPASYVKDWVNNYFSRQPLDGGLTETVSQTQRSVIY